MEEMIDLFGNNIFSHFGYFTFKIIILVEHFEWLEIKISVWTKIFETVKFEIKIMCL